MRCHKTILFLVLVLSLGLCALANDEPELKVRPDDLEFEVAEGGAAPASRLVLISRTGGAAWTAEVSVFTPAGGDWLKLLDSGTGVTMLSGMGDSAIEVEVDPTGLPPGEFDGEIRVSSGSETEKVEVELKIEGTELKVRPDDLKFKVVAGGPAPGPRQVNISRTGGAAWTAEVSVLTPAGGDWLKVSPTSGTGDGAIEVEVNPAGLPRGKFGGEILVSSGSNTDKVDVELEIEGAELKVRPDSLFFRQVGSTPPAAREVMVFAKDGVEFSFTAEAVTRSGNWLSVEPTSSTGPATLTVSVDTTGLEAGEFSGEIIVTAADLDDSPEKVKVKLRIGRSGERALVVRPDELKFKDVVEGGPAPDSRRVHIFNTGGTDFDWTAEASVNTGDWLKLIDPSSDMGVTMLAGTGDSVIEVAADPAGLPAGEFEGEITVTSGSHTAKVEVELEIGLARPPKLVIRPRAFNFIVEPNDDETPEPKELRIKNAGRGELSWTAEATVDTPEGGTWLSMMFDSDAGTSISGTGEARIKVTVDPTGLAPAMYSGKITVTAGTDSQEARVFLRILGPAKPRVRIRPKALKFTAADGTVSPLSRTLEVKSKADGLSFTATATTAKGGNWLSILPDSGPVPGEIIASVDAGIAGSLEPGVFTGNIEVMVPGAAQELHNVLVVLRVRGPEEFPELELSPGGMIFTAVEGGANPEAKKVELEPEGIATLPWTSVISTESGGDWLALSPATGTAPQEPEVSVNIAGLAPAIYDGSIVFTPDPASGAQPVTLAVKLMVLAQASSSKVGSPPLAQLAAGPLVALFSAPAGGFISQVNLPLNVSAIVLDAAGVPAEGATVVVSSSNGESDLLLEDVGGGEFAGLFRPLLSGPLTLTGSAQLQGMAAPHFAVSGDMESSEEPPTVIFPGGGVNGASFAVSPAPLSPGTLMSLFGQGLAGNGGVASSLPLPLSLGGVSVSIGGVPAPLFAAVPGATDQINLLIPFEVAGLAQAEVVVNNNGVLSVPEAIFLGPAVPALFTFSGTGEGPGAILHGSDLALVNASNPAVAGEVIALFATGLGKVEPRVSSGSAPSGLSTVAGDVQVRIGGQNAVVDFAGLAPRFAGLYQLNVRVPAGLPPGEASVVISVDGIPSTGQATVAVR